MQSLGRFVHTSFDALVPFPPKTKKENSWNAELTNDREAFKNNRILLESYWVRFMERNRQQMCSRVLLCMAFWRQMCKWLPFPKIVRCFNTGFWTSKNSIPTWTHGFWSITKKRITSIKILPLLCRHGQPLLQVVINVWQQLGLPVLSNLYQRSIPSHSTMCVCQEGRSGSTVCH